MIERQCAGCGFTFTGNLAIGSVLCLTCLGIVAPVCRWASCASLSDLRNGRGCPWVLGASHDTHRRGPGYARFSDALRAHGLDWDAVVESRA